MGLILCGLLLGLARTVFFPKEINYYENRYANRAALPTPGSYADGTFQDQLEAALGDQTPFAERFKARYNDLSSKLTKALLKPVLENGRYYRVGDVQLFSDYLTYQTRDLEKLRPTLEERAANYNAIFAAHPDTEFYVCYIFDTGRTDRENVLVIGESYDNAILKLLASHFGRTYSVDLRYYRNYLGSDFSLSDYLRRNSITKVLLIGNVDYYISPDFALEN